MSEEAFREHQNHEARKKWNAARFERMRSAFRALLGKTCWFDISSPANPLAPRVLGQIVALRDDELEVIDMSDARLPPAQKPRRSIAFAEILNWGLT